MVLEEELQEFTVNKEESGSRLDVYLTKKLPELSRSHIQKLIDDNHVLVGKLTPKPAYRVREGDRVLIRLPKIEKDVIPKPEDIPIKIVYEDEDLIVVDKPAGMVVHPAAGITSGTLVNAIFSHIMDDDVDLQEFDPNIKEILSISPERPGIVHRIDKGTSGLIVVAKSAKAYYGLAEQFREHSVKRRYIAIICGIPKQDKGTIIAPIGRSRRDRKKMVVTPINSRIAITHYSVLEQYNGFCLIEVTMETGRTHQIRVHLSYIGHPVLGDPEYGGRERVLKTKTSPMVRSAIQKLNRQALHASTLGFIHPISNEYLEFESPIPDDIQSVIDALRAELGSE